MKHKIVYVERKPYDSFSIEKAFRRIAQSLSADFTTSFQQLPFGNRFSDTIRNLIYFRRRPADIYHITGHIHYISLLFKSQNTVLSIMDVRFLYREPGLRRWLLKKLYLDWPLRRMRYVTAISEETKREIIRLSGCDPKKVIVLDLPLTEELAHQAAHRFNADKPTILQVGTMENKNIPLLAKALGGLNCTLRIVGSLSPEQVDVLNKNGVEFENVKGLSDAEVRCEYIAADLVAFCSLYEGFGLPIIEAQATGRPVITSNRSPMVEVAGGGAHLADPEDPASIRCGIEKIISDEGYRNALIEKGTENITRFSPDRVARQYEELYRRMLEE